MLSYVLKDLLRNPRRTMASVAGVALAVGLFSGIAFFVDNSSGQMTARAVAPVVIDMQVGVTRPLASALSVKESTLPAPPVTAGQVLTATITVTNNSRTRATAVTVKDSPPSQLAYVPGTTMVGPVGQADAPSPDGSANTTPLASGVNLGDLAPGASATTTFKARASADVPAGTGLALGAAANSLEYPAPVTAGDPPATDLSTIQRSIRSVDGVATAQPFALVDLPAGRLSAGSATVNQPVKVVAFDPAYVQSFTAIKVSGGQLTSGSALLSQPAADALAAAPGAPLQLSIPGAATALRLPLSGIVDFSSPAAIQLFASRNPDTQGEVVAVPNVVVVSFDTFRSQVLPALRADTAAPTPLVTNPPVIEYQVGVSRSLLSSDPATAVIGTQALRRTIERTAPGELKVIDNLSDTLTAAQKDSTLAKVLFLFLGLPGVLLAAYLSRYAGGLLAQAQRRERSMLRARGMDPSQLMRALAYNTVAVALVGAGLGLALGLAALVLVFGESTGGGSVQAFALSAVASIIAAGVTTTLALYLPARRALSREVADERRDVEANVQPAWLRLRLDVVMLVAAAIIGGITYLTGGYKPTPIEGQSVSLSFYILLAPLCFWVGGTLLLVRFLLMAIGRSSNARPNRDFNHRLVLRTLMLSVRRRPQAIASGVIVLSLAVAFGASLAIFVTTYQAEKLADARFVVGGDLRVTPTPLVQSVGQPAAKVDARALGAIPGVQAVTAMDQATVVIGTDKKTLAAIDTASVARVATLSPQFFDGITPDAAMQKLAADPRAALMDVELARTFNIQTGDQIKVQLTDRTSGRLVPVTLRAVGVFKNFPGFPQGVDLVTNLAFYQQAVHGSTPDTFIMRTDGTDAGTAAAAAAVKPLSTPAQPLAVNTTAKAYNLDQSSLSSLNIAGLGRLDGLYTVLMSALGIAIFVFGLLLQRAKEHVTMRALGIRMAQLQGLVLGEAGLVAVVSLVIGGLVGTAMALMFVQILRPLFVIAPEGLAVPGLELALLALLVLAAMALSSVVAGASLRRMHLVEILREE